VAIYFAFIKYLKEMEMRLGGASIVYRLQENKVLSPDGDIIFS